MISGAHVILYSPDAEADRRFLHEVLGFPHVDAGEGWLIFALPPSELAVHPSEEGPSQELFLMCEDLEETGKALRSRGVTCSEPVERPWGTLVTLRLPSGAELGLYQPKRPRPHG